MFNVFITFSDTGNDEHIMMIAQKFDFNALFENFLLFFCQMQFFNQLMKNLLTGKHPQHMIDTQWFYLFTCARRIKERHSPLKFSR